METGQLLTVSILPSFSEYIRSDRGWSGQLLLPMLQNRPLKDWKWIAEFTNKHLKYIICSYCQSYLDVAMSSLKTELSHRAITQEIFMQSFLKNQLGLLQALKSILRTLRYDPYRKAMFHVSRTQVYQIWKKLLRGRRTITAWEEIKGRIKSKVFPYWIVNSSRPPSVDVDNVWCGLL